MNRSVKVRAVKEPWLPTPVYSWSKKKSEWRLKRMEPHRNTWLRPILPAHPAKRRFAFPIKKGLGCMDGKLYRMLKSDYQRAIIILSVYSRSMRIGRYEDFMAHEWGFDYWNYPGPPIHYAPKEEYRLACCQFGRGGMYRYLASSKPLRNPVAYFFCQAHWYSMLRMSRGSRINPIPMDENWAAESIRLRSLSSGK